MTAQDAGAHTFDPAQATEGGADGSASADIPLEFAPTAHGAELQPKARSDDRLPIAGMALLCLASALMGVAVDHRFLQAAPPAPKIAFAEQGAVVLEAVLNNRDVDEGTAARVVGKSLRAVVDKYRERGFVVLDVTHSTDNQILVDAIPTTAIDITAEMRSAVGRALASAGSRTAGAQPGSASSTPAGVTRSISSFGGQP